MVGKNVLKEHSLEEQETQKLVYYLLNKDGGYIACYLDKEMFDEDLFDEDDCPEGEMKHENGRCVN